MKLFFTWMLPVAITGAAYSQPGTLDSSFSHNGKNTAQISSYSSEGTGGVAIDTHGRIVVAGDYVTEGNSDFAVCRFKKNGSLDQSFGGTGTVGLKIFRSGNGDNLLAHAVAVQQDNKVLIVGDNAEGVFSHGYIARVNADGTPDTSFGFGEAYVNTGSRLRSVAIQSDSKIVIAGYAAYTNNSTNDRDKFQVIRLNTDGTYDTTFGINGSVAFSFTKGTNMTYDEAYSVAIQPDGKIVVAGVSQGYTSRFAVARLLGNGALDKTFGKNGEVVTQVVNGSQHEEGKAVTIQNDGKILLAGIYFNKDHLTRSAVVRYLANGMLDTSYVASGKLLLYFPNALSYHHVTSIAMQPNGKAVIGGYIASDGSGTDARFALASINTDGTLDQDFGTHGIAIAKIGSSSAGYGLAVQSDGKIVEAGSAEGSFAVARFIGEGTAGTRMSGKPVAEIPGASTISAISNKIAIVIAPVESLKVYPNPAVNTATVVFVAAGKYTLQLSDMSGKMLMLRTGISNKGITSIPLNISRYAAGRYVLILTDEHQHRQTFELSKQ